jgi:hypothetical protein
MTGTRAAESAIYRLHESGLWREPGAVDLGADSVYVARRNFPNSKVAAERDERAGVKQKRERNYECPSEL